MLERTHLMTLLAVARTGSLTAAAEQLHVTQPALSHSIKKLEQHLGTPLWTKSGRNLQATTAGQAVIALAERLLPQFEATEVLIEEIARGNQGILRIGMECHPCYQWLLKVVEPFLLQWPKVDVDVKQAFKFGGMGALYGFEIDLLVTPDPLFKQGLCFTPVFDYEHVLVVSGNHPFASLPFVTPEQLASETLYTYPVEPSRLDIFSEFLHPAHITPKQHKTLEATDILLQMVAAGRGISALPGWLVQDYASKFGITGVRLGEAGIHKSLYIGTRADEKPPRYLEAFLTLAKQVSNKALYVKTRQEQPNKNAP